MLKFYYICNISQPIRLKLHLSLMPKGFLIAIASFKNIGHCSHSIFTSSLMTGLYFRSLPPRFCTLKEATSTFGNNNHNLLLDI